MARVKFDAQGRELPDPRPMEIPAHAQRPESLTEQVRRMVRTHMSIAAQATGRETFEEANDFDVDDGEPEFRSPYEEVLMDREVPVERAAKRAVDSDRESGSKPRARSAESRGTQVDAFRDDGSTARADGEASGSRDRVSRGSAARVKGDVPGQEGRKKRPQNRVDGK